MAQPEIKKPERTPLSKKARKLMHKGRERLFGVAREPNGRRSRRKKYEPPAYSWLAPGIKEELNMHPVEALFKREAITNDMKRAAYSWIADRAATGLPYPCPPNIDLSGIRAAAEERSVAGAARRYHDLNKILKERCGVYGHNLAYETCIQGQQNAGVANYWQRRGQKPPVDPSQQQLVAWLHLQKAFVEMENFYALQAVRRAEKNVKTAA